MPIPRRVIVFLVIGLVAASQSGNIILIGDNVHPVAIAGWRLLFASILLAPLSGPRQWKKIKTLTRPEMGMLCLAGVALACHFFAWIAAVKMSTVANAAIFFAVNPVITATAGALIFGEKITSNLRVAIAVGLVGVVVIGWSEVSFSPEHVPGDLMALLCSALFTLYFLLGKKLRQKLSTGVYVTSIYAVAAVFSFIVMIAIDVPVVDYNSRAWLCFGLMALIPTMIGHTSMNNALKYIDASRISVATVSEPLMAGVGAYFFWGQGITLGAIAGYALIGGSVILMVLDTKKHNDNTKSA